MPYELWMLTAVVSWGTMLSRVYGLCLLLSGWFYPFLSVNTDTSRAFL